MSPTAEFFSTEQIEAIDTASAGAGINYVKVSKIEGEERFRLMGTGIVGYEGWIEDGDKQIPIRWEQKPAELPDNIRKDDKGAPQIKFFMCGVVWDYQLEMFRILSMTQKSLRDQLSKYMRDDDYGDPTTYDIKISREGEGLNTKYGMLASPPKAVTKEIATGWEERGSLINLKALFDNDDPFADIL